MRFHYDHGNIENQHEKRAKLHGTSVVDKGDYEILKAQESDESHVPVPVPNVNSPWREEVKVIQPVEIKKSP